MDIDGMGPIPEGWYRDPAGGALERYFDGTSWTQETRPMELRRRRARAETAARATARAAAVPAAVPAAGALVHEPGTGVVGGTVTALDEAERPDGRAHVVGAGGFGDLPKAALPASPFRKQRARTASTLPVGPGNPLPVSGSAASSRRSLTDAFGAGVSRQSAQQLLLGTATELPPRAMRTAAGPTPSGWYPDPARGGGLRFFDGTRWTGRTRRAADESIRRLPAAALKLRARVLEAQDAAAIRRGPRIRPTKLVIPRASSAPSLRVRSRSGSVWGLLSTLLMVVGLLASALFAWQLWGTDIQNKYQQKHLEEVLSSQKVTGEYGDVPVVIDQGPAPTAGAAPGATNGPPRTGAGSDGPGRGGQVGSAEPGTSTSSTSQPAAQVHVDPDATGDGRPVGHISIPAIGLKRVFVLGTGEDQLALGPGLWKWGSFPGTPGNTTISGHRTTHGAPFLKLNELEYGDRIYIDVPGQPQAVYEVRGRTIASPFDVRVTQQTAGVRLTLTTCNPVGSVSERLVIEAELVEGKYVDAALPRSQWRLLR